MSAAWDAHRRREAERMNQAAAALYVARGLPVPVCAPLREWGNLHRTVAGERLLPMAWPAECGTVSGYTKHRREHTQACDACKEANAEAKRAGTGARMGRNAA